VAVNVLPMLDHERHPDRNSYFPFGPIGHLSVGPKGEDDPTISRR
jgi:hypothetical protein